MAENGGMSLKCPACKTPLVSGHADPLHGTYYKWCPSCKVQHEIITTYEVKVNVKLREFKCSECKDTGSYVERGGETQIHCSCPIGAAFSAAWMGTNHEEETVAAIDKMRKFLLGEAVE